MSRSAFDLQVVLDAVVRAAVRLCRADYGVAYTLDDGALPRGRIGRRDAGARRLGARASDHARPRQRRRPGGPDRRADPGRRRPRRPRSTAPRPASRSAATGSLVGVPIEQDGAITGVLALTRNEVRPFSDGGDRPGHRLRRAGGDRDRQRPAPRDDRAPARPARPLPVAPGRRARLEPGGRGAARRPPPRDHGDVLRPPQLHDLLRDGRAGGGPRLPAARTTRRSGRSSSSTRARSSTSPATG